jgi:hypothetical protein
MPSEKPNPEDAKAQQVEALFCNLFHVAAAPDFVRLTFGEAVVGTDGTYRSAVVMRMADAVELANFILRAAENAKVQSETKH